MTDIVTRLRQTRADMIGTDDEQHYWDCHDAAAEIERLRGDLEVRRLQLEAAASAAERLKSQIKLLDAAHAASHSGFLVMASGLENAAAEVQRLRLTDAEREAVERAIATLDGWKLQPRDAGDAATLRGLLERTK